VLILAAVFAAFVILGTSHSFIHPITIISGPRRPHRAILTLMAFNMDCRSSP
jgi:hypothetical protein